MKPGVVAAGVVDVGAAGAALGMPVAGAETAGATEVLGVIGGAAAGGFGVAAGAALGLLVAAVVPAAGAGTPPLR